ncbi:MAG: FAD:protein FMN transferase [Aigarchaeota archaeon]|nr:FAD:protein FMN transferase [Aigarchaeota archaeon]MCX8193449.1 FAD:protein FMN transferase [Nitrososphaeria archaeon]MDW7985819.1 FAD:protein FMN transferase [Nitrososphaerota archaeon]
MGTVVSITIIHDNIDYVRRLMDEAFSEFKRIESIMSIYDDNSEVSRLNKQGFLESASKELISVLREAIRISKITRGAYDVSILPLLEYVDKKSDYLDEEELSSILDLVDYSSIEIRGENIKFLKKGMKIVLNSIAKGYAVDLVSEYLVKQRVNHALINAGGDIRAIGGRTDKESWRIAIRNPFEKDKSISRLKIFNCSIASSGGYERRIGKGIFPHILNPRLKKLSSSQVVSATIITNKALVADALATGLCAMDPAEGIQLIEDLGEGEAMIITDEKEILKTKNFQVYEDD